MLELVSKTSARTVGVPERHPEPFRNGIVHPTLWLWDSWVDTRPDRIDLYCLALARHCAEGRPIWPRERNDFPFHVRRFRSTDGAGTWIDCGDVFAPVTAGDGYCARNVWSGSCIDLGAGRTLHALTGLRVLEPSRPFLQTLFLAESDADATALGAPHEALLCPMRDYAQISAAGYYLGPESDLGSAEGEDGGPILAWRDPFVWRDEHARLILLWSAKATAREACVGRAVLERGACGAWKAALQPPIRLPAGETITQAEVPKIYRAAEGEGLYLLVSGCDRVRETQPDHEVTKTHNLFQSATLDGPWRAYATSSVLPVGKPFLYGGSFVDPVIGAPGARFIAPYSERADVQKQLTFESLLTVSLQGHPARSAGA